LDQRLRGFEPHAA